MDVEINNGGHPLFSSIAMGLKQCKVVVVCVSDQYAQSVSCEDELTHAKTILNKPIIVIVVGDGMRWRETAIGLLTVREVFIDFRYSNKFEENMNTLIGRIKSVLQTQFTNDSKDTSPHDGKKNNLFAKFIKYFTK